jgi:hypothetical protein
VAGARIKQLATGAGFAAVITAYLFLLVPFTLYVGNIYEFAISYQAIAQKYITAAIFMVFVLGLVGMLLPARAATRYITLLAAIGILCWVQGYLLVWDYGLLDGRAIDWTARSWRGWLDLDYSVAAGSGCFTWLGKTHSPGGAHPACYPGGYCGD